MKRALTLCATLLLVCGAVHGIDYVWDKHSQTGNTQWDCGTNWNQAGPPTAADTVYLWSGWYPTGSAATRTVGQLLADNGAFFQFTNPWTLVVTDSDGQSGDFIWRSSHRVESVSGFTIDVNGNFLQTQLIYFISYGSNTRLILRGTDKAFRYSGYDQEYYLQKMDIYGSYWDNGSYISGAVSTNRQTVQVASGGQILVRPDAALSTWSARRFIFDGGQSNLPVLKANVDFQYGLYYDSAGAKDNGTTNLAVTGGVIYPQDVSVGSPYMQTGLTAGTKPITSFDWNVIGGSFTVGRDFKFQKLGSYSRGDFWLHTLENGTTNSVDVTVKRAMWVGNSWADTGNPSEYGAKFYDSTIRVGDCITVGTTNSSLITGAIDFGNSTVYLGGHFRLGRYPTAWMLANWNPGVGAKIICDGNGTDATLGRKNQTLTTYGDCGIALPSLIIHNECGTVSLANSTAGILRLAGDLVLECGTFNDNNRAILYNGPSHLLKVYPGTTITGGAFDNLVLLADAVVNLGSDITSDNIDMLAGSKLYLNGFTLNADGTSWDGAQVGEWAYEGGTIYGAAIPEPTTLLLLGTGALGVLGYIRRRRMA